MVNKLELKHDMTKVLRVDSKVGLGLEFFSVFNGVILPLKKKVCSPGLLLDTTVTLENQVASIV